METTPQHHHLFGYTGAPNHFILTALPLQLNRFENVPPRFRRPAPITTTTPRFPGQTPAPNYIAWFGFLLTMTDVNYTIALALATLVLFITNLLIILAIISSESLRNVFHYYLLSLSFSDLLVSIIVCPFALYASFERDWRFGTTPEDNVGHGAICKGTAYLGVLVLVANTYTFMWLAVDRYAAVSRPSRYDVEQKVTRCTCWLLFTWATALLLCCPTLLADMAEYRDHTRVCMIDWGVMPAFSSTLCVLTLCPTMCCTGYMYMALLQKFHNAATEEQDVRSMIEHDSTVLMSFSLLVVFIVGWAPFVGLRVIESAANESFSPELHFCLLWLGLSSGSWKFAIYMVMDVEFRSKILSLVCGMCTGRRGSPGGSDKSFVSAAKYTNDYKALRQQGDRYV